MCISTESVTNTEAERSEGIPTTPQRTWAELGLESKPHPNPDSARGPYLHHKQCCFSSLLSECQLLLVPALCTHLWDLSVIPLLVLTCVELRSQI